MTSQELLAIAKRQPFRPFRVVISTGEKYNIHHPDLIMVGRRSAVIGLVNDPKRKVYDLSFNVDLLHVVGTEDIATPETTSAT
jgi:hypothetical protein